jgi:acyl-CoA synthetase (AMP-forming)/AMP-acid ligase II
MIHDDNIRTLADLSSVQAQRYPDRKALVFQGESLTYRQLDLRSNRLASALLEQGIQTGARVALWAKDSLKSYEILFACAKIGAVFVPINWRLTALEIGYISGIDSTRTEERSIYHCTTASITGARITGASITELVKLRNFATEASRDRARCSHST